MNLKGLTKQFEGYRATPYKDTVGKTTIGYGFNIDDPVVASTVPKEVRTGARPLDVKEADAIFDSLYTRAQNDAIKYVGKDRFFSLPEEVQGAVTDMSYNMGYSKLNGFQKLKKALRAGDFEKAAGELKNSKWYGQVGERSAYLHDLLIGIAEKNKKQAVWQKVLDSVIAK